MRIHDQVSDPNDGDGQRYRTLFENAPVGIFRTTPDGRFLAVNPAFVRMLGYESAAELMAQDVESGGYRPSFPRDEFKRLVERPGGVRGLEGTLRRRDGTVIEIRENAIATRDRQGRVVSYEGTVEDISERRRAERALAENEERYRMLFENVSDIVILYDRNLRIVEITRSVEDVIGVKREALVGMSLADLGLPLGPELKGAIAADAGSAVAEDEQAARIYELEIGGTRKAFEVRNRRITRDGRTWGAAAVARDVTDRRCAERALEDSVARLRLMLTGVVQAMALTVERRDPYTAGHQRRVAELARAIAAEMGMPDEKIEAIRIAGIVHDIGKMSVPSEILSKPGKLSIAEFELIKTHSTIGYEILAEIEFPWPIAEMVLQHHERLDGSGYPRGLSGDAMLMEARILAVADAVEAIASHRPYRPALGIDVAMEEIRKDADRGKMDPDVVAACTRLVREKGFRLL